MTDLGRVDVLVFDVNETLSDLRPLAARFKDLGAPDHLAQLWFTTVLRDGFAHAAAGGLERFATLADAALRTLLRDLVLPETLDDAVAHVLDGFLALPVHPDVTEGVLRLHGVGLRLVTFSNGASSVAARLLTESGAAGYFEAFLSVEQAGAWKPTARAYRWATRACDVDPERAMMVAVHPWDCDGASRTGMASAWVDRDGAVWPDHLRPPDLTVPSLVALAEAFEAR